MTDRGIELQATVDRQISELIDLFRTHGEGALKLPCAGREKLGDGTVAAIAMHTADNYNRIAVFVQASHQMPRGNAQSERGSHRIPALMRARGHGAGMPDGKSRHDGNYRVEDVALQRLLERLSAGRAALSLLAELTDEQLGAVPPASDMKFSDGQRTLEQTVTSLLKHQHHQIDALKATVSQEATA